MADPPPSRSKRSTRPRASGRRLVLEPADALLAAEHGEHVEDARVARPVKAARSGWAISPSFTLADFA